MQYSKLFGFNVFFMKYIFLQTLYLKFGITILNDISYSKIKFSGSYKRYGTYNNSTIINLLCLHKDQTMTYIFAKSWQYFNKPRTKFNVWDLPRGLLRVKEKYPINTTSLNGQVMRENLFLLFSILINCLSVSA